MTYQSLMKHTKDELVKMILEQHNQKVLAAQVAPPPPPPPPPLPVIPAPAPPAYPDLSGEVRRLGGENAALTTEVAVLRSQLDLGEKRNASANDQLKAMGENLVAAQLRADAEAMARTDAERHLRVLTERHAALEARMKAQDEESASASKTKDELVSRLRERLADFKAKYEDSLKNLTRLGAEVDLRDSQLSSMNKDYHTRITTVRRESDEAHKRLTDEIGTLTRRLKDAVSKEQLEEAHARMTELQTRYNGICGQSMKVLNAQFSLKAEVEEKTDIIFSAQQIMVAMLKNENKTKDINTIAERIQLAMENEFRVDEHDAKYKKWCQTFAPIEVSGLDDM